MIQFNLLPDVKIKYIKARRQKRLVTLIAALSGLSAFAILLLTAGFVYIVQGAQLSSINKDIDKSKKSISAKNSKVDDINKVLTVQNQLNSLDKLHADKPLTSRMFDYLSKLTPSQVTISNIALNYSESYTVTLQGSTDTLETINKFVDTIKFTTFVPATEDGEDPQPQLVFTDVVLNSFGRDRLGASYSLTFTYDPIIFSSEESVNGLVVPQKTTTRSELGRPILQTDTEAQNNAPTPVGGTN